MGMQYFEWWMPALQNKTSHHLFSNHKSTTNSLLSLLGRKSETDMGPKHWHQPTMYFGLVYSTYSCIFSSFIYAFKARLFDEYGWPDMMKHSANKTTGKIIEGMAPRKIVHLLKKWWLYKFGHHSSMTKGSIVNFMTNGVCNCPSSTQ